MSKKDKNKKDKKPILDAPQHGIESSPKVPGPESMDADEFAEYLEISPPGGYSSSSKQASDLDPPPTRGKRPMDHQQLFREGPTVLHSGEMANWKIDCDWLNLADLESLAAIAVPELGSFGKVVGVPTGGKRFAEALKQYITPDDPTTLIVDDVLTTGASMQEHRLLQGGDCVGLVIFARGPYEPWIRAMFTYTLPLMPIFPNIRGTVELALREALQRSDPSVGAEHLLMALLRHDGPVRDYLVTQGLSYEVVRKVRFAR